MRQGVHGVSLASLGPGCLGDSPGGGDYPSDDLGRAGRRATHGRYQCSRTLYPGQCGQAARLEVLPVEDTGQHLE